MDHRSNYLAMVRRENPERLPFDLPMVGPVRERLTRRLGKDGLSDYLGVVSFGWCAAKYETPPETWRDAFAALGLKLPERHRINAFGHVHRIPDTADLGDAVHLAEMHPMLNEIEHLADVESLPLPERGRSEPYAHLPDAVAEVKRQGRVAIGGCACTAFERTWYLRGMDRVFMDLFDDHPITPWLLDYFTDLSCETVRAYARAGVDQIHLGDDVASQHGLLMSKDMWRTHLKPRLKRVIDTVREHQQGPIRVSYHSDGDVTNLIEDFIEIGIDILNPLQPECMDIDDVAARFGDRIGLFGGIGTQTTMPFGTPDDVRAAVAKLADVTRRGCAVLAAPTHVLEPDVPDDNIDALVEAIAATDLRTPQPAA